MEQINYKNVYIQTLLTETKKAIKANDIKLSGVQEQKTDQEMQQLIEDLFLNNENKLELVPENDDDYLNLDNEELSQKIKYIIILYYTALYFDNLSLLEDLLEQNYNFKDGSYRLNLYVLDKRISSQFNSDTYIKLIKQQRRIFKSFYLSLKNECYLKEYELSDKEVINKFCCILNKNPQVSLIDGKTINNLLTKKTLCYFDEATILNANPTQKTSLIPETNNDINLTKNNLDRLTNLMKNHNFSINLTSNYNQMLNNFTDEELLTLNTKPNFSFNDYFCWKTGGFDIEQIKAEINPKRLFPLKIKKRILNTVQRMNNL